MWQSGGAGTYAFACAGSVAPSRCELPAEQAFAECTKNEACCAVVQPSVHYTPTLWLAACPAKAQQDWYPSCVKKSVAPPPSSAPATEEEDREVTWDTWWLWVIVGFTVLLVLYVLVPWRQVLCNRKPASEKVARQSLLFTSADLYQSMKECDDDAMHDMPSADRLHN